MSMTQTDREAWRRALGIKEPQSRLQKGRLGSVVERTAGRSGGGSGGGDIDGDVKDKGEGQGAEKGDGALNGGGKLSVGDKGDRLEDLYDCETGEKVTLDGLGEDGTQAFPMSFENCNDPNSGDDPSFVWYYEMRTKNGLVVASKEYSKSYDVAIAWITSKPREGWIIPPNSVKSNGYVNAQGSNSSGIPISDPSYREWTVTCFNKNITPPPDGALEIKWPTADRNHLNWNKDKGCYEPLCPELNTQVDDKFQGCKDELELCDAPVGGKRVKVKINNGVTEVTQERYNQTATIKDGKVTSVKALSESQTEAAFR